MNKLGAFLNLFRKGAVISDPVVWKQRQVTATVLGSVIMAVVGVANAYGYNLPIDNETALAIAGGVLGVVNICLTYVSSDKIGVGREPDDDGYGQSGLGVTPTEADTSNQSATSKDTGLELNEVPSEPLGDQVQHASVPPVSSGRARSQDNIYQN